MPSQTNAPTFLGIASINGTVVLINFAVRHPAVASGMTTLLLILLALTLGILTSAWFRLRPGIGLIMASLFLMGTLPHAGFAGEPVVSPQMAGAWKGEAKIIVTWCKQKTLPIQVNILKDGTVTGTIGDATLQNGKLRKNRGAIGRKLNIKTDFIIEGKLKGAIVSAEGINRSRVKIPLNFGGGFFKGGLHTSGIKFGGKKAMSLSASSLTLNKQKQKRE